MSLLSKQTVGCQNTKALTEKQIFPVTSKPVTAPKNAQGMCAPFEVTQGIGKETGPGRDKRLTCENLEADFPKHREIQGSQRKQTGKHSLKEAKLSNGGFTSVHHGRSGRVQHTEVESSREMRVSFDLETRP